MPNIATKPMVRESGRYINYSPRLVKEQYPDKAAVAYKYVAYYYQQLLKDQLLRPSFHDSMITGAKDFGEIVFSSNNIFSIVLDTEEHFRPVGHLMLSGFYGKMAMAHFCVVKDYHGIAGYYAGMDAIEQAFLFKTGPSEVMLEAMIGVIPVNNEKAIKYAYRIGFKHIATVPKACFIAAEDTYVDGDMSLLTAKDFLGV
jgi:hypothetical protein